MMPSTIETGHAKNIANFQQIITFCQSYGTAYNPTKENLSIASLQQLQEAASNELNATKAAKTNFDNTTNARREEFANLKSLATKTLNALKVSGADQLAVNDAISVNRKLQGTSSTKAAKPETETTETPKQISTSQQSYDRQVDHFATLIGILEANTKYQPNEVELKTDSLKQKLTALIQKNSEILTAYTDYSNAMIKRDVLLYNPLTGLVQTAKEVKIYIKSLFGANSSQYKQISGIEIKKVTKGK